MSTYNTPGVYVKEIPTLPPSIAEVATAIPAFIGYTEIGDSSSDNPVVKRISSMLEYSTEFGSAQAAEFSVSESDTSIGEPGNSVKFSLYYALNHYFKNGGGPCYVVSIGNYKSKPNKTDFDNGLKSLAKEDEPTLIVLTDAACVLSKASDYYYVCGQALMQCKELGDRFVILDVYGGDWKGFRDDSNLSVNLEYGAAYHPYLITSMNYEYTDSSVTLVGDNTTTSSDGSTSDKAKSSSKSVTLESVKSKNTSLYNSVKANLGNVNIILPPSAAMAGIYARVDREQGVWKAPANEGVLAILGPVEKITDGDQESLNIDPVAGKSINAIRAFTGKGTLVWGARTLAGNDNEWRYVSVRRLFITIEESTKKASSFAVFEPNDQSTWLKVKAMIESYLYGLWQQGALAGAKPEDAYYVNVGLGTTMTPQDILEGRMSVEIGIAAVRPAEFIILKFSHKLQTS